MPDNKRRQDLRFKKIFRNQSKSCRIRKQIKTLQLKLDQGKGELPKVVELDKMSIKPRDENKEKIGNKSFYKENKGRYSFLKWSRLTSRGV